MTRRGDLVPGPEFSLSSDRLLSPRRLSWVAVCLAACGEGNFAPFGEDPGEVDETGSSSGRYGDSSGDEGSSGEPGDPADPPLPAFDGDPLPDGPVGQWQWVDFPESQCRDGSSTGIGVRRGSSDNLVIFFEGGGACFNGFTCLANDPEFGADEFFNWAIFDGDGGIFDASHEDNPVRDWSFVYVPYCSGDVHAGDASDVSVPDIQPLQRFAGYSNVELFLRRIVPTFGRAPHVLVTGVSAGGFGAGFNYHRLTRVFPGKVTLLDDSGPAMRDNFLSPCLQRMWRDTWGLDATIPPGCSDCAGPEGGGISMLLRYLGGRHPEQRMGLISSERDRTIAAFYSFGLDECAGLGAIYTSARFRDGLHDLRDNLLRPMPNWGTYFIPGDDHTWIGHWAFYTTEVDGVRLVDWVADLIDGEVSHISPPS